MALSTGEAELYALNKTAAQSLGLQSLLRDLGVELDVRLHTDATTGRATTQTKQKKKKEFCIMNSFKEEENEGT